MSLLDPGKQKFDEAELTTILHILLVWLWEKKYHSIYLNKMVKLLNILIEPRHAKTLATVLVKINMVSMIHEAYFKIDLNEVFQKQLLADQLFVFFQTVIKRLAKVVTQKVHGELEGVLSTMNSWNELLNEMK